MPQRTQIRDIVWFDAASPAQALWFSGLAPALAAKGFSLLITARSQANTAAVASKVLPKVDEVIEGHRSGNRMAKMGAILARATALRRWAAERAPEQMVAVSHNSYSHIMAARSLGMPTLTSMDYEGQPANHLAFRLAHRVLLPEAFPDDIARRQGAQPAKTVRYPGIKESVYLSNSRMDPSVTQRWSGLDRPLAVVRPEASYATYHSFQNPLVATIVDHLLENRAYVVFLPRDQEQAQWAHARWNSAVEIPDEVIDGPSLLATADLFVGAGGTMTREAASLGTPTYSIFRGAPPSVDRFLEARGLLKRLQGPADTSSIVVRPKERSSGFVDEEARATTLAVLEGFMLSCNEPTGT